MTRKEDQKEIGFTQPKEGCSDSQRDPKIHRAAVGSVIFLLFEVCVQ